MSGQGFTVSIADRESRWRQALATKLAESGHVVSVIDDGQACLRALIHQGQRLDLMIVGDGLGGLEPLDAVYLAGKAHEEAKRKRSDWPVQCLMFICPSRQDLELIELLRRRGFTGFVYRSDAIERTAAEVTDSLLTRMRGSARYSVKFSGVITRDGDRKGLSGTVTDLSDTGVHFRLPARHVQGKLAVQEIVRVRFTADLGALQAESLSIDPSRTPTLHIEGTAEVRRVGFTNRLFAADAGIGLRFLELDKGSREALATLLQHCQRGRLSG